MFTYFSRYFTLISRSIHTAEQFEQLKAGEFDVANSTNFIQAGTIPNIFNEVSFFANSTAAAITFNDEYYNYISIQPKIKYVSVYLTHGGLGADQFVKFPNNYKSYNIHVHSISSADIDAIEQWQSATNVEILVDQKPRNEILDRITELSQTKNLHFSLSRIAHMQEQLAALRTEMSA